MYTVKQLADLAGVSRRTLHYYDEIGLLEPTAVAGNGYRKYDGTAVFRLQQILFYRELGLELARIQALFDDPDFDAVAALRSHRQALEERVDQLQTLIKTVDATMMHLIGEIKMSENDLFEGFSAEKQAQYEEEAIEMWGDTARKSIANYNKLSEDQKRALKQQGDEIYAGLAALVYRQPSDPEVQALLARWHAHIGQFYEPSPEMLAGLGNMYLDHPEFNATFSSLDPELPAFLQKAITIYVNNLQSA